MNRVLRPQRLVPALLLCSLAAAPAFAEPTTATPTPEAAEKSTTIEWKDEPDTLGKSWTLAATGAWVVPFGRPDTRLYQREVSSNGWNAGLEAAYGLNRTLALGLSGDWSTFGDGRHCSTCSTTDIAIGPRLRYHLVQGTRLDPWVDFGIAYRQSTVSSRGVDYRWSGVDFARIRVGGEWFPIPMVGIGPFMGLNNTLFWDRPKNVEPIDGSGGTGSTRWRLTYDLGLRAVVRFPGRF